MNIIQWTCQGDQVYSRVQSRNNTLKILNVPGIK